MKKPALYSPQEHWVSLSCVLLPLATLIACSSADTDLEADLADASYGGTTSDDVASGGIEGTLPDIVIVDGKSGSESLDSDIQGDAVSSGSEVSDSLGAGDGSSGGEDVPDADSPEDASSGVGQDGGVKPPLDSGVGGDDATTDDDGGKPPLEEAEDVGGPSPDDGPGAGDTEPDSGSSDGSDDDAGAGSGDSSGDDDESGGTSTEPDDGPGDDTGNGSGDGTGNGSGDGTGNGSGDGTGNGSGDGTGTGSGDGTGNGSGDGTGTGSGNGSGDDTGTGSGDGTGNGSGDGTGNGSGDVTGEPCEVDADCASPASDDCASVTCVAGVCEVDYEATGQPCSDAIAAEIIAEPPCIAGLCNGEGSCLTVVLAGAPCDDDDACTSETTCSDAGMCTGGKPTVCASDNPCVFATCDSDEGCGGFEAVDGLFCDDNDPCTNETTCFEGVCQGGENLCDCLVDEDCYDDGNDCNGVTVCVALPNGGKGCQLDPASVVSCEQSDDPCMTTLCDPTTGLCTSQSLAGAPCDDGLPCTLGDTCDDTGVCMGSEQVCDDAIPCTLDSCDPTTGQCVFSSNEGAACDDGDVCTKGDVCTQSVCAGLPLQCDDANPCTDDVCDPSAGGCIALPAEQTACDDGSACTELDTCQAGVCVGQGLVCDDGNPCTDDACDAMLGCTQTPNNSPCDDGSLCTTSDTCTAGQCLGLPVACDDGLKCTFDDCDPAVGCTRVADPTQCADGNACTDDICDLSQGCVFVPVDSPCDDGDACTFSDQCVGGVCASVSVVCDDGLGCTLDGCDPATGACTHEPQDALCQDDNPCTTAECDAAVGCVTASIDGAPCDDGAACTEADVCAGGVCMPGDNVCPCAVDADCDNEDLCDGVYTCQYNADGLTACVLVAPPVVCAASTELCQDNRCDSTTGLCTPTASEDGSACSDGDVCTVDDQCAAGICVSQARDCADDIECTLDACVPDLGGCVNQPNNGACDDDIECTVDSCSVTQGCIHLPDDEECVDDVPCTIDSCESGVGCVWAPDDNACADDAACTVDICYDTGCVNEPEDALCDDANPCTTDACQGSGCVNAFSTGDCEDGDLCTVGDTCVLGDCEPGTTTLCDDGNPCTADTCKPDTGDCAAAPVADDSLCEDGDACTLSDTCQAGLCSPGVAASCDDGIDCTSDSCDAEQGCLFNEDDALCDDANPCTIDVCIEGQGCVYEPVGEFTSCDDTIEATGPDLCIQGLCRGFKATSPSTPSLWCNLEDASIVSVDDLDGNVFAVMNYRLSGLFCGASTCEAADGGFAYCQSRVLRLNGVEAPEVIANVGGTLSAVSHDAVVGANGQIGQISYSGSVVVWGFSELAQEVAAAGQNGGKWTSVWADRVDDDNAVYFLAGRSTFFNSAKLVQCELGDSEDCDLISLTDNNWPSSTPVDVDGTIVDGTLAGLAVASNLAGGGGAVFSPAAGGGLNSEVFDEAPTVSRTLHEPDGTLWVAGQGGLLAVRQDGQWSQVDLDVDAPQTLTLSGLTTAAGHLVIAGYRSTDGATEAIILSTPLVSGATWSEISLGVDCVALDVHGVADGLYVGGSCGDGVAAKAMSWFMPLF